MHAVCEYGKEGRCISKGLYQDSRAAETRNNREERAQGEESSVLKLLSQRGIKDVCFGVFGSYLIQCLRKKEKKYQNV